MYHFTGLHSYLWCQIPESPPLGRHAKKSFGHFGFLSYWGAPTFLRLYPHLYSGYRHCPSYSSQTESKRALTNLLCSHPLHRLVPIYYSSTQSYTKQKKGHVPGLLSYEHMVTAFYAEEGKITFSLKNIIVSTSGLKSWAYTNKCLTSHTLL